MYRDENVTQTQTVFKVHIGRVSTARFYFLLIQSISIVHLDINKDLVYLAHANASLTHLF